jgi:hypothetical protein
LQKGFAHPQVISRRKPRNLGLYPFAKGFARDMSSDFSLRFAPFEMTVGKRFAPGEMKGGAGK